MREMNRERDAWIAVASALTGREKAAASIKRSLQRKSLVLQMKRLDLAEKRSESAKDADSTEGQSPGDGTAKSRGARETRRK